MVHIDQSYDKFIKLATQIEIKNSEAFLRIKKRICKEIGLPLPTNADIRELYEKMVAKKEIKKTQTLKKHFSLKEFALNQAWLLLRF
jgi:ribosomal protein S21